MSSCQHVTVSPSGLSTVTLTSSALMARRPGRLANKTCSSVRRSRLDRSPLLSYSGRHEPSYSSRHEESYPSRQEESYPSRHEPSYPSRHKPSYPSRHEASYPSRHEESYPSRHEPSYPSRHKPSYPSRHEESYPSRHEPSYRSRHEESYLSRHEPSYPSRHDPRRIITQPSRGVISRPSRDRYIQVGVTKPSHPSRHETSYPSVMRSPAEPVDMEVLAAASRRMPGDINYRSNMRSELTRQCDGSSKTKLEQSHSTVQQCCEYTEEIAHCSESTGSLVHDLMNIFALFIVVYDLLCRELPKHSLTSGHTESAHATLSAKRLTECHLIFKKPRYNT